MNTPQPGPVLPFAGFLDVLRSKGYGVGLNEHFALAQLLDRWDRTHAEELADATQPGVLLRQGEPVSRAR